MKRFISILLVAMLILVAASALASCTGRPGYDVTGYEDYTPPEFTEPEQTEPQGDNEIDFFDDVTGKVYETYENGERVTLDPDEGWGTVWY